MIKALICALALMLALPTFAQEMQAPQKQEEQGTPIQPPVDRKALLDKLFELLKVVPEDKAPKVEKAIIEHLATSESDTANLLMKRAEVAHGAKDNALAIELLSAIVALQPDLVEAWNRRALSYLEEKRFGDAIADIEQVLAREPRHFAAINNLATLFQMFGNERRALELMRKALEINPHMKQTRENADKLEKRLAGEDI